MGCLGVVRAFLVLIDIFLVIDSLFPFTFSSTTKLLMAFTFFKKLRGRRL